MSDYIAEAITALANAAELNDAGLTDLAAASADAAQAFATLAVADQLRVANLLAAAASPLCSGEALVALRENQGFPDAPVYRFRPEIASVLGIPYDDGVVDAEVVEE